MANESDFMNVSEAADLLGIHLETLRRLARQKQIPAFKLGRSWRFRRAALVRWADEQHLGNQGGGSGFSVLVIDDDEALCRALSRMIAQMGYGVRQATRGAEGLELVAGEAPDLILLDLKMPDMDGPQFLEELRARHPELPVVIVTGNPDGELMKRAARHAPLLLLAKPVDREALARTVRTAAGEKSAAAANRRNR